MELPPPQLKTSVRCTTNAIEEPTWKFLSNHCKTSNRFKKHNPQNVSMPAKHLFLKPKADFLHSPGRPGRPKPPGRRSQIRSKPRICLQPSPNPQRPNRQHSRLTARVVQGKKPDFFKRPPPDGACRSAMPGTTPQRLESVAEMAGRKLPRFGGWHLFAANQAHGSGDTRSFIFRVDCA